MNDSDLVERGLRGELKPGTAEYDTFVDTTARRPSGENSVAHYRNPEEHLKDFNLALRALDLKPDDRYLEVGFGGGQLLEAVLRTVTSAGGIDHSADMLALASERNGRAIVDGRLQLLYGDVHSLPWPDDSFTCAACVNMFFFVTDPMRCLRELHRVLKPGSRLVIVTAVPGQAESGPWSAAMRTYSSSEMTAMLRQAGFATATVEDIEGRQVISASR